MLDKGEEGVGRTPAIHGCHKGELSMKIKTKIRAGTEGNNRGERFAFAARARRAKKLRMR